MLSLQHQTVHSAATLLVFSCFLLASCRNLPDAALTTKPEGWDNHVAIVTAMESWNLNGRLNIRQDSSSDTVNLSWRQNPDSFDINMSGTLGLGAVNVRGTSNLVVLEKAGENPMLLPGLGALSREFLGYEFPAEYLLYWVRGLPVPDLPASAGWNDLGLLTTLEQQDSDSGTWTLDFDRYAMDLQAPLPGRIRLQHEDLRLTFLISAWELGSLLP